MGALLLACTAFMRPADTAKQCILVVSYRVQYPLGIQCGIMSLSGTLGGVRPWRVHPQLEEQERCMYSASRFLGGAFDQVKVAE